MKTKIEIYKDRAGKFRWRAKRKGRIVADSGQGYARRSGAVRGLRSMLCDWPFIVMDLNRRALLKSVATEKGRMCET